MVVVHGLPIEMWQMIKWVGIMVTFFGCIYFLYKKVSDDLTKDEGKR
uniref:Uncharacterized protein n=1 Tax=viral metagenome TaxID=1070528 RepID=A0A6M3JLQ5_9ZZZZ